VVPRPAEPGKWRPESIPCRTGGIWQNNRRSPHAAVLQEEASSARCVLIPRRQVAKHTEQAGYNARQCRRAAAHVQNGVVVRYGLKKRRMRV